MNKKTIIKNTEKFAKNALSGEGTGHDWWHIHRVRKNAELINKKEKADGFIIELAVLLHDVGDKKVTGKEESDHAVARNFLEKEKVKAEIIDEVMYIIENISFSQSVGKGKIEKPREFQVVEDADRLDALGAVGVARAFAFGGNRNRPLYDPLHRVKKTYSNKEYQNLNSSTFHHFYEKILKLKDLMNTKTGKSIAVKRHLYVENYIKQFLSEWNGEK